jgi:hypothetical protein
MSIASSLDIPEDLRDVVLALAEGGDIYACTFSEDRASLHLRLFIDGAPYLHAYVRDSQGHYQLTGINALGQVKF